MAVARDRLAPVAGRRPARQVARAPARLLDDQVARGDVPGVELELPEPVEAPGGDITQIERGAAVAAQPAHALHEAGEVIEIVLEALVHVVGEARGEQRAAELALVRDAQDPPVAGRAFAARG